MRRNSLRKSCGGRYEKSKAKLSYISVTFFLERGYVIVCGFRLLVLSIRVFVMPIKDESRMPFLIIVLNVNSTSLMVLLFSNLVVNKCQLFLL